MDLKKTLIPILAIFCIVVSAAAVCATDASDYDGWAGSQYQDDGGWAGSQYQDDSGNSTLNQTNATDDGLTTRPLIDPDYAHHEPAAGEPINNQTGDLSSPISENTTSNSTGNITAGASNTMLATGNPILLLLTASAAVGGYAILRKR